MPQIGVDEWVAETAARTETRSGPMARLQRRWHGMPLGMRFALLAVVVAGFPLTTSSDFHIRVGINTLLLVILAIGLNVVVGWAGLLDLGYIAFYGFGAYTYALLSSDQLGVHLPTMATVAVAVVASGLVGLLLGLPSRRLLGDYLAVTTLFFGQAFVELVLNLDSITGGPNGIAGVDPFSFFGFELITPTQNYYLAAIAALLVIAGLHLLSQSRTGRAWRAVREDPLAAAMMSIPPNALKLRAFAVGAAVAGLAGSIFAAVQAGAFPRNFGTPFLILIYAAVVLGGAGSLAGVTVGAVVVSVALELLRDPDQATVLFLVLLVSGLVAKLRPWSRLAAVIAAVIGGGFALRAIVGAAWPETVAGDLSSSGAIGRALDAWLLVPDDPKTAGNVGFVVLVVAVIALGQVGDTARTILLAPVVYLAVFVWEVRLVEQPSITRQLLLGALLVVVMVVRPHGILGTERKEIV